MTHPGVGARARELPLAVGKIFLYLLLAFVTGWLLLTAASAVVPGFRATGALASWLVLAAFVVAQFAMVRLDRRSWATLGLAPDQARPRTLGTGLLFGAAAVGIPSLLLLAVGWLRPVTAPAGGWLMFALAMTIFLLPAAFTEELAVRGYPFAVLRELIGWRATLVVTSIVFGLLHLGNPGVSTRAILLVMLAGIFLGSVLVATRSLYAAGMAHFAWNWVMAALLHSAVSGLPMSFPDYRVIDAGPDWATGGPWGPEGGLFAAAGMGGALFFLHRRRRAVAPREEHTA